MHRLIVQHVEVRNEEEQWVGSLIASDLPDFESWQRASEEYVNSRGGPTAFAGARFVLSTMSEDVQAARDRMMKEIEERWSPRT